MMTHYVVETRKQTRRNLTSILDQFMKSMMIHCVVETKTQTRRNRTSILDQFMISNDDSLRCRNLTSILDQFMKSNYDSLRCRNKETNSKEPNQHIRPIHEI